MSKQACTVQPIIEPLKHQDRVALVCPGSLCLDNQQPTRVKQFLQQRYGLQTSISLETTQHHSAELRAARLLAYLLADDIKLIAALRGGEGTADILPFLHLHQQQLSTVTPKWLLGFSDITALLVYFAQYYRWPVIHGASLLQCAEGKVDAETERAIMGLLFDQRPLESGLNQLQALNTAATQTMVLEAELTGGCLSLIDISIKDIWEINASNKIIFLEDYNEKAHKISRTLKYLARIGVFEQAKAIIFGDFTCAAIGATSDEQDNNRTAIINCITRFASEQSIPVLYSKQFGHGKTNLPLVYCRPYRLSLGQAPSLKLI